MLKKPAMATIHFSAIYRCLTSAGFGAQTTTLVRHTKAEYLVIYSQDFSGVPAMWNLLAQRPLDYCIDYCDNRIGMSVWPLSDILSDILKLLWEDFYYTDTEVAPHRAISQILYNICHSVVTLVIWQAFVIVIIIVWHWVAIACAVLVDSNLECQTILMCSID